MDPSRFRRDPWLRTSGYHLVTWSLLAFVLELRSLAPDTGDVSLILALASGAVLTSFTHERRVGKMAGAAGEPVWERTGVFVTCTLALLFAASAAAAITSRGAWIFPLWMTGAGALFVVWGIGAAFSWFAMLGGWMLTAAAVDAVTLHHSGAGLEGLRLTMLGALLPAFGILTSYRYLWFRAPGGA